MQMNTATKSIYTREGAKAKHINPILGLKRSVLNCMLWEREFYEDGKTIGQRIADLIPHCDADEVSALAIEARNKMKLRHVPLLIVREMSRLKTHRHLVSKTLAEIVQRPDELAEFLALYWADNQKGGKKQPISNQVKKGLAKAFTKFNEYSLAKYNREREIKLRDVLFLCHAKPKDAEQAMVWKRLVDKTLATPDTWETELSAGKDKFTTWTRLLKENKLGALALLRNLRNMKDAGVDDKLMKEALKGMKTERVLPFRFIAAARYAPALEPALEDSMFKCLEGTEKLLGKTLILIDVSGSMDAPISAKSDLQRIDAACGLAMLLREIAQDVEVTTFSEHLAIVPPRRGFALRDAVVTSQPHSSTYLGKAITVCEQKFKYDRLIVITDEQSADKIPDPKVGKAYVINVASAKNGVGYGKYVHLDGWSESIIDYIREFESNPEYKSID